MHLINGQPAANIDVGDRGLHYGDGLFETLAVRAGVPLLWERHMQRLTHDCARLGIAAPDVALLHQEAEQVCAAAPRAVLKIIITRGVGGRGYRCTASTPTRILTLHPWLDYPDAFKQQGVKVRVCATRLGMNPALAGVKHLNRLEQVLARNEWDDADIPEGLMLDGAGRVVEGTMTNVFAVRDGVLLTPDVSQCGVAGVMRALILEQAAAWGIKSRITQFGVEELTAMHEIFVCNSLIGVWPLRELAGVAFPVGPLTRRIAAHVDEIMHLLC
ncbi:MAG: aminodeoxychorismate lyase [Pseudomonadota bacterium]